ncbi:MAG TPA: DNA gyrase inhibitor YacG [Nevskiaceae bacterium]|nr:DNA gyrase inhibitor YacG [Nevskiaceae bacterium]
MRDPRGPCPQCRQTTGLSPANPWRPFCSERCKLLDLGEWMSGRYALPADPADDSGLDPLDGDPSRSGADQ